MTVTAAMVKDLREKTGAGMMDCKKALSESNGDVDAAVKYLREKGLAAAAKKAGRIAAEGLVDTFVDGKIAAMVEVNCETDFVAKNEEFQTLVKDLAEHVAKKAPAKVKAEDEGAGAALYDQEFKGGKKVGDVMTDKISTIGENMNIRRMARLDDGDAYGSYLHMGGKIGVLVSLQVKDAAKASSATATELARDVAMHVASEAPLAVSRDGIDPAVIENEKSIFIAQAREQGKPDNIIEKMVVGKVNKFVADSCLLEQAFVKDPDIKVGKLVEKVAKELGTDITVKGFVRFKVGEGLEKKADNFAEEVAKMTGAA